MQAIRGHVDIMNRRQAIADVIADADSPDELKNRLQLVRQARAFAVDELLLPDNDSYRSYADLGRDYVVWNVFAAPEFSLQAKTWCFPVAGCVAYRGYFSEDAAQRKADKLRRAGYDVAIGGVSAYSTLGKFEDPVLNTMMRWSDVQLISTMFHELAHQKLYVKGDSAFNESFATAVADIGIVRWLEAQDDVAGIVRIDRHRELRRALMRLVDETRTALNSLYGSALAIDEMRARKQELLDDLSARAAGFLTDSGSAASNWLAPPLNNARLVSLGLYEGYQAGFEQLYAHCSGQLACFYAESAKLAKLDPEARSRSLRDVDN